MTEYSTFLRQQRVAMNLSMGQLARRAGVSQPYISQIESGQRNAGEKTRKKLNRALGYDVPRRVLDEQKLLDWLHGQIFDVNWPYQTSYGFMQVYKKIETGEFTMPEAMREG